VLLARGDPGPALTLLQRLLDAAVSQGRTGSIIEIQALRALAPAARGDHASAFGALTEALTLTRRHGYVRVLADEGAPMRACSPSCPRSRRASSARLAASTPATWPRSRAPAAKQTPLRPAAGPPRRRAWPSR
jgi:LuxR family maltose regulon positive regulatory protein